MRKKVIVGSILVISAVILVTAGAMRAAGQTGSGAVSVQASAVARGDLSSWIYADGIVEEVEKSEVYFDTPMKVVKVMISEGQHVKRGQQLIEVDMGDIGRRFQDHHTGIPRIHCAWHNLWRLSGQACSRPGPDRGAALRMMRCTGP